MEHGQLKHPAPLDDFTTVRFSATPKMLRRLTMLDRCFSGDRRVRRGGRADGSSRLIGSDPGNSATDGIAGGAARVESLGTKDADEGVSAW